MWQLLNSEKLHAQDICVSKRRELFTNSHMWLVKIACLATVSVWVIATHEKRKFAIPTRLHDIEFATYSRVWLSQQVDTSLLFGTYTSPHMPKFTAQSITPASKHTPKQIHLCTALRTCPLQCSSPSGTHCDKYSCTRTRCIWST